MTSPAGMKKMEDIARKSFTEAFDRGIFKVNQSNRYEKKTSVNLPITHQPSPIDLLSGNSLRSALTYLRWRPFMVR